jgi:phage shock protein C
MKRLYRSENDKVFAGILGGLGEYLDIDPTILRLIYILIAILTGLVPAVIGYIIAYLIVPPKPRYLTKESNYKETPKKDMPKDEPIPMGEETKKEESKTESMV